jgi:hypothetical protein
MTAGTDMRLRDVIGCTKGVENGSRICSFRTVGFFISVLGGKENKKKGYRCSAVGKEYERIGPGLEE